MLVRRLRRQEMRVDNLCVSVIVPVYNGEHYLAAALDSVVGQNYRPLELIVVDDGSTDRSADIARSYEGVCYVYQPNQGHGPARNAGIAAALGEFIAFLDADDVWAPDKLRLQAGYLLAHPEVGCVICHMHAALEPGMEWPAHLNRDYYGTDPVAYVPSAILARRAVFDRIGGFDGRYRHGDDSDWFFRARDAGVQVAELPDCLLTRRIHAANQSHGTRDLTAELLRVTRASVNRKQRSHT
jgi:glycosyltransferase involved in cell wall biosynthesis